MSEPEFQRLQRSFAAHLRNPERHPAPSGIEERRLTVYRQLFFNNLNGFLEKGFPVLHSLYDEAGWRRLVRCFFDQHACTSPYFLEIPEEFVTFLAETYQPGEGDPPFLAELAHYEWIELVLDTATDTVPEQGVQPGGDLLRGVPYLNPLHCVLNYRWPVHQIGPDHRPDAPPEQPVWLLVYRNTEDRVAFMEINAVTARLLALMQEQPLSSGEQLLQTLGDEMGFQDRAALLSFGADLLQRLRDRELILGARLQPTPA